TKHNQGGKGLGVRLFASHEDFDEYLNSADFEVPADGITLLQEYLRAAQPRITRAEIVGGEFVYAITADTELGGFQLCPADAAAQPVRAQGGIRPSDHRKVSGLRELAWSRDSRLRVHRDA